MILAAVGQVLADAGHVLADAPGEGGATSFLDSDIGKAVVRLCGAIALLIMVVSILRMVKSVTGGRPAEGFKVLLGGLLVGGLLINLNTTVDAVSSMSDLIENVFNSFDDVAGTS